MEEIAIEYGVLPFEQSRGIIKEHYLIDTKMVWIEYCPNYVIEKRNGFGVCKAEKVIALAYCRERVPFSFRNSCDYYLVGDMKRLKRGCVFQTWAAPQLHEIAQWIQRYPENQAYKKLYNELNMLK